MGFCPPISGRPDSIECGGECFQQLCFQLKRTQSVCTDNWEGRNYKKLELTLILETSESWVIPNSTGTMFRAQNKKAEEHLEFVIESWSRCYPWIFISLYSFNFSFWELLILFGFWNILYHDPNHKSPPIEIHNKSFRGLVNLPKKNWIASIGSKWMNIALPTNTGARVVKDILCRPSPTEENCRSYPLCKFSVEAALQCSK